MTVSYYSPGSCNLNPAEAASRMKPFYASTIVGLVILMALVLFSAPAASGFVLSIPALTGALAYLQSKNKFCVTYARKGVYSKDETVGSTTEVVYEKFITKDLKRAQQIKRQAFVIALLGGSLSAIVLFIV